MWRKEARHACEFCKGLSDFVCEGCKSAHYCSPEHQKLDWDNHKSTCQLYANATVRKLKLAYSSAKCRVLVAQNTFRKGDVILSETPLITSPDNCLRTPKEIMEVGLNSSCIVCRKMIPPMKKRCKDKEVHICNKSCFTDICINCNWPICEDPECNKFHGRMECEILHRLKTDIVVGNEIFSEIIPPWRFIFYLRIFRLREINPSNFDKILELDINPELDDFHFSIEDLDVPLKALPLPAVEIAARLKGLCRLLELYCQYEGKERVAKLVKVVDWNSRSMTMPPSTRGKTCACRMYLGLFSGITAAQQSCVPNAMCVHKSDFKLHCIATENLEGGSIVMMSKDPLYCHLDNIGRKRRMKENGLGVCHCYRCQDPTEMCSFNGAFKCGNFEDDEVLGCKMGNLLPFALEKKAKGLGHPVEIWTWKCDQCGIGRQAKIMGNLRATLLAKTIEIMSWEPSSELWNNLEIIGDTLDGLVGAGHILSFIGEYEETVLHPNNFILSQLRLNLMERYSKAIHRIFKSGKQEVYQNQIIDAAHKLYVMSSEALELLDILRPGINNSRALLAYFNQQGFILAVPKLLRAAVKTSEEKSKFRKTLAQMAILRRHVRLYYKHTMYCNWDPKKHIERLEWVDLEGQLYKLLKRRYGSLYLPTLSVRKFSFPNQNDVL